MEYHQVDGMAMIFQEGEVSDMPPLPENFKKCGNLEFSWEQLKNLPGKAHMGRFNNVS